MKITDFFDRIQAIIDDKNSQIEVRNAEIVRLRQLIKNLQASSSWRLTAPLRSLHGFVTGKVSLPADPGEPWITNPPSEDRIVIPKDHLEWGSVTPQQAPSTDSGAGQTGNGPAGDVPSGELDFPGTGLDFFVFPIIDWEFRFQRPQQLAMQIASHGHRVFYFKTTFTRVSRDILPGQLQVTELTKNIFQVRLMTRDLLNIYRDLVHGRRQEADLLDSIAFLKTRFGIRNTVSIVDHPFWYPIARKLGNNFMVYDCMDDHSGFDTNHNIAVYEPALTACADLVVVSSEILKQKVSSLVQRLILVRNGTDFEHFHQLPEKKILGEIRKPVIGYYGAVAEWFDVDLVAACAKRYREFQFIIIGRVTHKDIEKLQKLDNVMMPGEIPYKELPGYVSYFDVCLIPFHLSNLIEATNPVKFYEYLSSGKPVVSVMLPELIAYRDNCYLSETKEQFIENIELALKEDPGKRESRIALAKENSWIERGNAFLKGVTSLFPKVSIAIVTYNNLVHTKLCYESLKKYTCYPDFEMIFVDNASQDGTQDWLTEIAAGDSRIKIILNEDNKGFAAGNNQALGIARGDYFVFLNNDTVVTHQWLESLVRHFLHDHSIGLICPMTNETGNEACVRVTYQSIDGLQAFSKNITDHKSLQNRNIRCVPLFCAMMRTGLLREIGGLYEGYSRGMFEDDELSLEIKKRSLRVCYAEDVFIHHFGRASFKQLDTEDYKQLFTRNKNIFESRWGKWIPHIRGWFNDPIPLPEQTEDI